MFEWQERAKCNDFPALCRRGLGVNGVAWIWPSNRQILSGFTLASWEFSRVLRKPDCFHFERWPQ